MWKLSPHRDVWRALLIKSASREKHVLFMTPLHPPTHLPPCYHLVGQMLKMTKSSCRQQHIIQVIKWSYAIWSFSFSFFFSPKVSCESAISYISPVLPCSLPVIKGHIILLSCRQKDGKGLQADWTILHLTRATTEDASFVPRSVQFVGSNTLFCGYYGLFSHGND